MTEIYRTEKTIFILLPNQTLLSGIFGFRNLSSQLYLVHTHSLGENQGCKIKADSNGKFIEGFTYFPNGTVFKGSHNITTNERKGQYWSPNKTLIYDGKWYIKDKNEGWDVEGKQDGNQIVNNVKGGVAHKASSVFVENNPDFLSDDKKGQVYAETLHVAMNEVDGRDVNQVLKTIEETCKL